MITDAPYADLSIPVNDLDLQNKFARQVMLVERERCAKVADSWYDWCGRKGYDAEEYATEDIAAKIRSGK